MKKYFYDFHMHSCLSPCGDDDMTPSSACGVAKLAGLDIVALTDHNSVKNCPAFFKAADFYGITPIAGMELTTSEDIHVVCLFEELEAALDFDSDIQSHRMLIPNKVEVFGNQLIMDEDDNVIGIEENFLTNATDISIDNSLEFVSKYGGICYPAHIDRESNGTIAILGTFPEYPNFLQAEFSDLQKVPEYLEKYPILKEKEIMFGSDAHYLLWIKDRMAFLELPEHESSKEIRAEVFRHLRGEGV